VQAGFHLGLERLEFLLDLLALLDEAALGLLAEPRIGSGPLEPPLHVLEGPGGVLALPLQLLLESEDVALRLPLGHRRGLYERRRR
jgi:hypothetical protein